MNTVDIESLNTAYKEKYNELKQAMEQNDFLRSEEEIDCEIICDLMDEGAPLSGKHGTGLLSALRCHFQFLRQASASAEETEIYVHKIKKSLNQYIKKKKLRDSAHCTKTFNRLIMLSKNKFKNYLKHHPMGDYRKGAIVLALLMAGYPVETIAQVLLKHKEVSFGTSEDIDKILAQCKEVINRYDAINKEDLPSAMEISSTGDLYRYYARDYTQKTQSKYLNYRDDLCLAAGMLSHLVDFYKEEHNIRDANNPLLKKYIEEQIKPKLLEGILAASPVAREYGRDINDYAKNLVDEAEVVVKKAAEFDGPQDRNMKMIFQNLREKYIKDKKRTEDNLKLLNDDALIAKEMMTLYYGEAKIREALKETSPILKEMDEAAVSAYLTSILRNAREAINKEEAIISFERKDTSAEISIALLYQQNMLDFAEASILNRFNLCAEGTDYNIACKLFNEHPDIDNNILAEAINAHSPRRALLGADENYGVYTVDRAFSDIQQATAAHNRRLALKEEFEKTQGFIREGVYNDTDPILANQYGKLAMRSFQRGYPLEIFKKAMLTKAYEDYEAGNELGAPPEEFVSDIIKQAAEVIARNQAIQAINISVDRENRTVKDNIQENYIEMAQQQLNKKSFIDRSMDINFARAMLKQGYPEEAIIQVLSEYSPVYAEPGHSSDSYLKDVLENGKDSLAQAKEALLTEVIILRDDFQNANDEFAYQQRHITQKYDLPYTSVYDEKIAVSLLKSGIDGEILAQAIQEHSPLAQNNPEYGVNLIERLASSGMLDMQTTYSEKDLNPAIPEHSISEKIQPDKSQVMVRTLSKSSSVIAPDNDES